MTKADMYHAQTAMFAAKVPNTRVSDYILRFHQKGERSSTLAESKEYWQTMTGKKAT